MSDRLAGMIRRVGDGDAGAGRQPDDRGIGYRRCRECNRMGRTWRLGPHKQGIEALEW